MTNQHPPVVVENADNQKHNTRSFLTNLSISNFFSSNGNAPAPAMDPDVSLTPVINVTNDRPVSTSPIQSVVPDVDTEIWAKDRTDGFQLNSHFLTKHGSKHHPYPREAPYMQAYDPILLDNDRFTEELLRRLNSNGSPTFYDYGLTPPMNVLDLGCGHGGWVMEAAAAWKSFGTEVTGFDLVDVSDRSWDLLDNITWVQGNFLNHQLPFADNSFDLVRMANLSLAIPQDSWCRVLSEVRRILAPEGRLELIDDQILFPYDETSHQMFPPIPPLSSASQKSSFDSDSDDDMISTDTSSTYVGESAHSKSPHYSLPELAFPPNAEWKAHSENSKGLESIFQGMLMQKHGINPQPQDIIDVVLSHVFGRKHSDQIKCMRLALAPVDCMESDSAADRISRAGSEVGVVNQWTTARVDEPINVEGAHMEDKRDRHTQLESPKRLGLPLSFQSHPMSVKAVDHIGAAPGQTEGIGARPASRFKIYKRMGKWNESVRGRRTSMESLHSPIPEFISLKAAERLGIAPGNRRSRESQYSSEMKGTAYYGEHTHECIIPSSVNRPAVKRLGATQSPGLILWPSTFISMEPSELEMHACKHMHVLLGCKAALSEFIQDVGDANGKAYISQDELNDLTWEYECFRRKRFNWPMKLPKSRLSISSIGNTPKSASTRPNTGSGRPSTSAGDSTFFRRQSGFVHPKGSYTHQREIPSASEPSLSTYDRKDLTFVRVFRVYEAFKVDEPED